MVHHIVIISQLGENMHRSNGLRVKNGFLFNMGYNVSAPNPFFGGAGIPGMSPQTGQTAQAVQVTQTSQNVQAVQSPQTVQAAPSDGVPKCPGCGAPRGTGKYCTE